MKQRLASIVLALALVYAVTAPPAHANYIGGRLTGCGTTTGHMKKSGYNVVAMRLATIRWSVQTDWCRNLTCYYFKPVACYYGRAYVKNVVVSKPTLDATGWGMGLSLKIDMRKTVYRNHVEGGDWGTNSEVDVYVQAHVQQCLGWLISTCSTKASLSWKMALDGSGQAHYNYKWNG